MDFRRSSKRPKSSERWRGFNSVALGALRLKGGRRRRDSLLARRVPLGSATRNSLTRFDFLEPGESQGLGKFRGLAQTRLLRYAFLNTCPSRQTSSSSQR